MNGWENVKNLSTHSISLQASSEVGALTDGINPELDRVIE